MIFNQIKHKGQNISIEITANILSSIAGDTALLSFVEDKSRIIILEIVSGQIFYYKLERVSLTYFNIATASFPQNSISLTCLFNPSNYQSI